LIYQLLMLKTQAFLRSLRTQELNKNITDIIYSTFNIFSFSRIGLIYAEFSYRTNGEFQFGYKFGQIAVLFAKKTHLIVLIFLAHLKTNFLNKNK